MSRPVPMSRRCEVQLEGRVCNGEAHNFFLCNSCRAASLKTIPSLDVAVGNNRQPLALVGADCVSASHVFCCVFAGLSCIMSRACCVAASFRLATLEGAEMSLDAAEKQPDTDAGIGVIEALLTVDGLDKRTKPYKQFVAIVDALQGDLGGVDQLSEIKKQLIRRVATLCVWCEAQDAAALCGEPIDPDLYGRVSGHMRRLSETLGCERVARDVTYDLRSYLARTTLAESARAPADVASLDDPPEPSKRTSEPAIEAAP